MFGTFLPLNTCNLILVEIKQNKIKSLPGLIFQQQYIKILLTNGKFEFGLQINEKYFFL